jgi:hypothetical protein
MVYVKTVATLFVAAVAIAPILAAPVQSGTVLQSRDAVDELVRREPLNLKPVKAAASSLKLPKTPLSALGAAHREHVSLNGAAHRGSKHADSSKSSRHSKHDGIHDGSRTIHKVSKAAGTRHVKAGGFSKNSRLASSKLLKVNNGARHVKAGGSSKNSRLTSSKLLKAINGGRHVTPISVSKPLGSTPSLRRPRDLDEVELMEREPLLGIGHLKKWIKDRKARKAAKEAAAVQGDTTLAARDDSDLFIRFFEENADLFERDPIFGINHFKKWRQQRKAKKAAKAAAAAAEEGEVSITRDLEGLLTRELELDLD